jgi:hypothetical protein
MLSTKPAATAKRPAPKTIAKPNFHATRMFTPATNHASTVMAAPPKLLGRHQLQVYRKSIAEQFERRVMGLIRAAADRPSA